MAEVEKLNIELNITESEICDVEFSEPILTICDKINIFYAPDSLEKFGYSIAMIGRSFRDIPEIMVDDYFFELSDECKKFVLLHEIGHYVLGHLEDKPRTLKEYISCFLDKILPNRFPIEEQEADYYAYNKLDEENKALVDIYYDEIHEACLSQMIVEHIGSSKSLNKKVKQLEKDFSIRKAALYNTL